MPDEIDIAPLLPYFVEVTITDISTVLQRLCPSNSSIQLPFRIGEKAVLANFDYGFSDIGEILEEPSRSVISHDLRATAVELIVANEIYNRIGLYLRDAVTAVATRAAVLETGESGDEKFYYDEEAETLIANSSYLENLLDLSAPIYIDPMQGVIFDVEEINLQSPFKIKSRVAAILLQLNIILAPGAPAAVAPPTVATASQAASVLNGIGAVTGAATLGYTVYARQMNIAETQEQIRRRVMSYKTQLAAGNTWAIQNDLKLLNYYHGEIDNKFKELSLEAASNFAKDRDLSADISYKDEAFLRALANATIELMRL